MVPIWHIAKTIKLLKEAGFLTGQCEEQPVVMPNLLVGPFSKRPTGSNGYEILNGDGNVVYWAVGERNAEFVVKLLNLADKHGKLPSPQ